MSRLRGKHDDNVYLSPGAHSGIFISDLFVKFRVGLAMAELAATHVKDLKPKSNRDDYFITGFLRERLPWISLRLNNTHKQDFLKIRINCCFLTGKWTVDSGATSGITICQSARGSGSRKMYFSTIM